MGWLKNLAVKLFAKKVAKDLDLKEGPMDGAKKWYKSKTIWSDVLTVVVGLWGVLDPVLASHGVNLPTIPPLLLTVLGGMGIHGRVTASQKLGV